MDSVIPLTVIEIRRELCAECSHLVNDPCAACEHGRWGAYTKCAPGTPRIRGLGDIVERIAKPIAQALGIPCHGTDGRLKPESPCAKRRDAMNRMFPINKREKTGLTEK